MSTKTLSIAAALMVATSLSTTAQAGGVRLGFGFPLGVFAASQLMASGPGGGNHDAERPRSLTHSRNEEEAPRRVKHAAPKEEVAEAPVRKIKHVAPKEEEVAEAPIRKIKRAAPKVEVAEAPAPRPHKLIKTAKLENTSVVNDVAPVAADTSAAHADAVFTQPAPEVQNSNITGTQSTPAAVRTASLATQPTTAVAEAPGKTAAKTKTTPEIKRLCRKFSAAIAGLIEIPCD